LSNLEDVGVIYQKKEKREWLLYRAREEAVGMRRFGLTGFIMDFVLGLLAAVYLDL
jgi:hypothetical protein